MRVERRWVKSGMVIGARLHPMSDRMTPAMKKEMWKLRQQPRVFNKAIRFVVYHEEAMIK